MESSDSNANVGIASQSAAELPEGDSVSGNPTNDVALLSAIMGCQNNQVTKDLLAQALFETESDHLWDFGGVCLNHIINVMLLLYPSLPFIHIIFYVYVHMILLLMNTFCDLSAQHSGHFCPSMAPPWLYHHWLSHFWPFQKSRNKFHHHHCWLQDTFLKRTNLA